MGKAIKVHLSNGKSTYCGITIHKNLEIAIKGELFFESNGKTIRFNCLCKNCVSIMVKQSKIYRNYIERVKSNESIVDYENRLPKSIRAMKAYCAKRKLNWNSANTKPSDKLQLQVKSNSAVINTFPQLTNEIPDPIKLELDKIDNLNRIAKGLKDDIKSVDDEIIELVNPIEIGEKTIKGKNRELRKSGVLPYIKKVDKSINRIQNEYPIAMVKGFGNNWKVIEEFSSMGNCNSANVKELTGWVPIAIAQKVYNQYVISRVSGNPEIYNLI